MPARWLTVAIVAFWLSANGWLFWRDIWPDLRPNQPPPVTIDLVEEVQTRRPTFLWTVLRNQRKVFQGKTNMRRLGPDAFELHAEFRTPLGYETATVPLGKVKRLQSSYRVNARGDL